ncbi:MAG: cell division protein FtsL [Pseudohongiellaceae bacterium]
MNQQSSKKVESNQVGSIYSWSGMFTYSSLILFVSLGAVLVTGLSVVQATHDNRFSFNELQELKASANQLDVEWGQLLLEQSTFGVEGRIQNKAATQLKMQVPEIASIVMVKK